MLFNKNEERAYDRVIFQTKPNIIFGCKKAIFGIILLILILIISPRIIRFVGDMQVYLISYIKVYLTQYVAIAFFIIIFIDILYIIGQLINWYSIEYILTESRIIIKSGVVSSKKNYMPYTTIQDINTSQSIFAKIFNIGSVYIFSAYDKNQMELKHIYDPSKVEEILFSKINSHINFPQNPQRFVQNDYYEDYDKYEPNTPMQETRRVKRNYDSYPKKTHSKKQQKHKYKYEPYKGYDNRKKDYEHSQDYDNHKNDYSQDNYYNQIKDEYSYTDDDYNQDDDSEIYYNDGVDEFTHDEQDYEEDLSQDVIKRHFEKFKK